MRILYLSSHHGSGVLPLGEFVENPQQVDAGEQIPPTELITVSSFLLAHAYTARQYTRQHLSEAFLTPVQTS